MFRKFLGALVLGLPCATVAHVLAFGGAHRLGGDAHGVLLNAVLGVACLAFGGLGAGGVRLAALTRNGSIVASALERWAPGTVLLCASTLAFAAGIESLERATVSPILALASIVVAALVAGSRRRLLRGVARWALALAVGFAERALAPSGIVRRAFSSAPVCPRPVTFRLLSRPPPVFS